MQFTVFISVVIALLLAGALLLAYTHRFFIEQSKGIINNIQLADTGTMALLTQDIFNQDTLLLNIPDVTENQKVYAHLSHWGIFEKAFVRASQGEKEYIKCSLVGSGMASDIRPALYLQETFKPLALVGATEIRGDAYLPEQGLTTGSIAGHSYYGTELIFGKIKKSTVDLPKLKYDYKELLTYYLKEFVPASDTDFLPLQENKNILNSFKNSVKGVISEGPIILTDVALSGNIIIRSAEKITVRKTAILRDIILAAPLIIIEDGVSGTFQAIASKSIKVGKNCFLEYPSALAVLYDNIQIDSSDNNDQYNDKIFIDANSTVSGTLFYLTNNAENNFKANIYIDKNSTIKGEVYCLGNMELRGKVAGTVFTNQFITNEGGTVYVNHLYDAIINSAKLPENFGGILLEDESKRVMKWLY